MINWLSFRVRCLLHAVVAACILSASFSVNSQSLDRPLRERLLSLTATEGITVDGLEFLGTEKVPLGLGHDVGSQLRALLQKYNYVLAYDLKGSVTKILILGLRQPPAIAQDGVAVVTTRQGPHHLVETILVGPTGAWRKLSLIVDTGATSVVLPSSMASELGFGDTNLSEGWVETAGGRVRTKVGRLASVSVGQAKTQDVAVTFIDDAQIGDKALLGMSFLNHFRLTIEDSNNRILLMAR